MNKLEYWSAPDSPIFSPPRQNKPNAVVLVHGFHSNHDTFDELYRTLSAAPNFAEFDFYYFDYEYMLKMETNADRLGEQLASQFSDTDKVVIIAHSMGGIVSRLALLRRPLPFLRMIFLLGTPNAGAVRLMQLTLLLDMAHTLVNKASALFPRKAGIFELTNLPAIIDRNQTNDIGAMDVDYVSIPGQFYHQDRSVLESFGNLWTNVFTAIDIGSRLTAAFVPFASLSFARPHDGIVEEASNDLTQCPDTQRHEKTSNIAKRRDSELATYVHLQPEACKNLIHVAIHKDAAVIAVISDIILTVLPISVKSTKPRLEHWISKQPHDPRGGPMPRTGPDPKKF